MYIQDMLKKFQMTDSNAVSTPFTAQTPISVDAEGKPIDRHHYRSMIGSLLYLTTSRPDIMFVVCYCTRYQTNPRESHEIDVKRIFRYLKGSPKLGLWYPKASSFDLVTYSDSHHGGCQLDIKSVSRGCQYLGQCLMCHGSAINKLLSPSLLQKLSISLLLVAALKSSGFRIK
ncbi:hypothetical protein L1987_06650 [Smallanthus sonchifolius]|uniref:Uncharacterized protein n=1 Tax=Smallanthus sonchifolius TaxID=185202 RepID=A0ACB9JYT2_9ASTR|nr:hypothetical protein L1987_06650 [Smallanthus sonchifolius]